MGRKRKRKAKRQSSTKVSVIVNHGPDRPTTTIVGSADGRNARRWVLTQLEGLTWVWAKYKYQQGKSIVSGTLRKGRIQ